MVNALSLWGKLCTGNTKTRGARFVQKVHQKKDEKKKSLIKNNYEQYTIKSGQRI